MRTDNLQLQLWGGQGYATHPTFGTGGAALFKPASLLGMPDAASIIGKCNLYFVTGHEQCYLGCNQ